MVSLICTYKSSSVNTQSLHRSRNNIFVYNCIYNKIRVVEFYFLFCYSSFLASLVILLDSLVTMSTTQITECNQRCKFIPCTGSFPGAVKGATYMCPHGSHFVFDGLTMVRVSFAFPAHLDKHIMVKTANPYSVDILYKLIHVPGTPVDTVVRQDVCEKHTPPAEEVKTTIPSSSSTSTSSSVPSSVTPKPQSQMSTGIFIDINGRKILLDDIPTSLMRPMKYPDPIYYNAHDRATLEGIVFAFGCIFTTNSSKTTDTCEVFPVCGKDISSEEIFWERECILDKNALLSEITEPDNTADLFCVIDAIADEEYQPRYRFTDYKMEARIFVIYDRDYMNSGRCQTMFVSHAFIRGMMYGFQVIQERDFKECRSFDKLWITHLGSDKILTFEELKALAS